MCRRLGLGGEESGALEDDVDAERAPRKLRRVALREHADSVAVDDHRVAVHGNVAREFAVHGVVSRQMRIGFWAAEVVDRDDRDVVLLAVLVMRSQYVAADAAVTVDGDLDRHGSSPEVVKSGLAIGIGIGIGIGNGRPRAAIIGASMAYWVRGRDVAGRD